MTLSMQLHLLPQPNRRGQWAINKTREIYHFQLCVSIRLQFVVSYATLDIIPRPKNDMNKPHQMKGPGRKSLSRSQVCFQFQLKSLYICFNYLFYFKNNKGKINFSSICNRFFLKKNYFLLFSV